MKIGSVLLFEFLVLGFQFITIFICVMFDIHSPQKESDKETVQDCGLRLSLWAQMDVCDTFQLQDAMYYLIS